MQNTVSVPRDSSVDIAKGIGMLFVIAGHCDFNVVQDIPAFSFHMPFFFFVSGFFLNFSHSFSYFVQKKFFTLIIPFALYYIAFGIITHLIHYIHIPWGFPRLADVFTFHNLVVAPIIGGIPSKLAIPLWFITSLFISMCVVFSIGKGLGPVRSKATGVLPVAGLILVLIGLYYALIYALPLFDPPGHHFPQFVVRIGTGAIYCAFGYLFYRSPLVNYHKTCLIAGAAVYAYLTLKFGYNTVDMIGNNYGTGNTKLFSIAYILAAIMMVLSTAKFFAEDDSRLTAGLTFLGKNSFHIMALHLSAFFLLNLVGAAVSSSVSLGDINDVNYTFPRIGWVYFSTSLIFSVLVIKGFDFVKSVWNGRG